MGNWPGRDYKFSNVFWPPSLLIRQFSSMVLFKNLVGWPYFFPWLRRHSLSSLPVAAGAFGMGCIGYPAHPVLEVTGACNLSCIHCHASSGKPAPDEMSTAEVKGFIDSLTEAREFRTLVYSGGEPLVRPDLLDLLHYSKSKGLINIIATNGILIDDSLGLELKKAGVAGIAVSLDARDPGIHNHIRQSSRAFDLALRGIEAVKRAGMLLQINATAMEYNFADLKNLLTFSEEIGSGIVLMYQLIPVGRGSGIGQAALKVDQNESLLRFLAAAQKQVSAIVEPVAGPQYWPFLMEQKQRTGRFTLKMAEKVFHGCAAGRGFVYIKANGDVWACPFLEESAGSVRQRPFLDIWRHSSLFQNLRQREKLLKGRCGECRYRKMCGGCRGRAYACSGDYMAEDPSCFIQVQQNPDNR